MAIKKLTSEEKNLLNEIENEIASLENSDKTLCPIAVLPSSIFYHPYIRLYENRIECDENNIMYMLNDPKIKVECFISGDVQYTADVSGGVMYEGYSTGVTTKQIKHDNRCLIFRVEGPDGIISFSEDFAINKKGKERKEFQGQYFYDKMLEAISSYKKNKQVVDKKFSEIMKLKKAYYKVLNEYEYTLPSNLLPKKKENNVPVTKEEKRAAVKIDERNISKSVNKGLLFCIVGLLACWIPLLSNVAIASSVAGLYKIDKIRKNGNTQYKNRIKAGYIIGGIGLAIESMMFVITVYAFIAVLSNQNQ